jgi:hypothetical protein
MEHQDVLTPVERLVGGAITITEQAGEVGLVQEGFDQLGYVPGRRVASGNLAAGIDEPTDVHVLSLAPCTPLYSPEGVDLATIDSMRHDALVDLARVVGTLEVDRWPDLEPDDALRAAAIDVVPELHKRATAIAARHVDTQRASSAGTA